MYGNVKSYTGPEYWRHVFGANKAWNLQTIKQDHHYEYMNVGNGATKSQLSEIVTVFLFRRVGKSKHISGNGNALKSYFSILYYCYLQEFENGMMQAALELGYDRMYVALCIRL